MAEAELVIPDARYLGSYIEAINEYEENGVKTYYFNDPRKEDIFAKFERYRIGRDLPENRVPASYFWLVADFKFIGEISIRHQLSESLLKYGGHIGYGIRYTKWNQGYGTIMLHLALQKAKELGLSRVLITCDDDNVGSAKVIEKNNGITFNIFENNIEGKQIRTRRYWINLV